MSPGEEHHLPRRERCCWHSQGPRIQAGQVLKRGNFRSLSSRPFTTLTRERQGSLQEQRPLPKQCGQYYRLCHSFYAASTLKVDTRKSHCSHSLRLKAKGATFPSSGLLGIQVALTSLGSPAHSPGLSPWKPGMWAHLPLLFLLCLAN